MTDPLPPALVSEVLSRMREFATTAPTPQQTRQKSAREMVGHFASELTAALVSEAPRKWRDVLATDMGHVFTIGRADLEALVSAEARLEQAVERFCRFNCDAESSCCCAAHMVYRAALSTSRTPTNGVDSAKVNDLHGPLDVARTPTTPTAEEK